MDANNIIQTKPFSILMFCVNGNIRCKEIAGGELITIDANNAVTVMAKDQLHTRHARTVNETITAADDRYTFERML